MIHSLCPNHSKESIPMNGSLRSRADGCGEDGGGDRSCLRTQRCGLWRLAPSNEHKKDDAK